MDDRYLVETPEIVDLAYDVAGLGSRCLAAAIDTLLLLTFLGTLGATIFITLGQVIPANAGDLVLALWSIISFASMWGYYMLFEVIWAGQTPGKRLLGLRTVREGGRPITAATSAIRNLIRIVDFLPFGYGLGALVMFADPRSRRLGDLAAGTLVVREGATVTLDQLTTQVEPLVLPPPAPDLPALANVQILTPDEYGVAQEFLRRRRRLGFQARERMAAQLAQHLQQRLALEATLPPETLIEQVVREYSARAQVV
ncbi:RDD domain-containing protein [Oscillochloris trichoides DG-6]|uniref:RDD domain-containing protein n=1 Tax=Oscillochloris trichoides DG-6 TaxID=765420 RepID=E1ICJ5_9CHLR|nr:RDD family protein [Oscillochloris trichoides]EFO81123.1 RDD domain-containing protein [Oscillochloris trichoides DG-6]